MHKSHRKPLLIGLLIAILIAIPIAYIKIRKWWNTPKELKPKTGNTNGGTGSGTRNVRNNNPGNIVISSNQWVGKIPASENTDGKFEQFDTPDHGIRAHLINTRTQYRRGKNTIQNLILTLGPDAPDSYIQGVADRAQVDRFTPFSIDSLPAVCEANAFWEGHPNPFTISDYNRIWATL